MHKQHILLMYTKRYDDFSLPGGGVDEHESIEQGLIRELQEETGAQNIVIKKSSAYMKSTALGTKTTLTLFI